MSEEEVYIPVPLDRISPEALEGLVQEFVLREGTDYGHAEPTLEDKVKRVKKQLESGRAQVVFSTLTQDTTIIENTSRKI